MKNNIKLVLAYGNARNKIKTPDKMYAKVFDKKTDKVIFFECYMERPIGFCGEINISYVIYSGKTVVTTYEKVLNIPTPGCNMITMGLVVVNPAGEHIVNGNYTAKIVIDESDAYYFDFEITGKDPTIRYTLFRALAKYAGL